VELWLATVNSASTETVPTPQRELITSRLHHVGSLETPSPRLHRGTQKASKRERHKKLGVVPGGGVEPPRYQVPADFETAAGIGMAKFASAVAYSA
jgi:hypothetical protein